MPYGDEMPATEFQQFIRLRKEGELDIYSFVDVYYGILNIFVFRKSQSKDMAFFVGIIVLQFLTICFLHLVLCYKEKLMIDVVELSYSS